MLRFFFFFWFCTLTTLAIAQNDSRTEITPSDSAFSFIQILETVQEDFNVGFIYESDLLKGITVDHMENDSISLEYVLSILENRSELSYVKISETTYVIKGIDEKPIDAVIYGRVIGEGDLEQLPGVYVQEQGSLSGTITDKEGNYKLKLIKPTKAILEFNFIGYAKKEVVVRGRTEINVKLISEETKLSEVVITAVGLDRNKRELGYSIQNISSDDLRNARESNIAQSLSAKVAGVQVISSSGSPGAAANIRIRGNKSINSSNSPIFVLDGMVISNTTSGNTEAGADVSNRAIDINTSDIKKMTILKGPAATVLYGSRAANGVIMITTYRGAEAKPAIKFSTEFGVSQVNRLPEKQSSYAQGRPDGGAYVYRGPETGEQYSYGPLISDLEFDGDTDYPYDKNGRLVSKGLGNGQPANAYNDYDTFWVKGLRLDQNLSVQGGSSNTQYYFSVGHLFQSGVVVGSDFRRLSLKANMDFDISDQLSLAISNTIVASNANRTIRGSNISGATVGLYRNTPTFDIGNGNTGKAAANDQTTYQLPDGTQRAYRGNGRYDNPFWVTKNNPYSDQVNRIISNGQLKYRAMTWLTATAKIGIDNFTDNRDIGWDINSSSEPTGRIDQISRISERLSTDLLLNIDKKIFGGLFLHATLGHNYYSQNFEIKSSSGRRLSEPNFFDISNATDVTSDRTVNRSKIYGVYLDSRFVFRDFLFVHFAGRNDWSSRLPQKNNSFFYPAASIGFELTEAMKWNSQIFSRIKLRGAYGRVGNAPSIYQTQDYYRNGIVDGDSWLPSTDFPAYGINAFERGGRKGNDDLLPELTNTLEFGSDLKLFKNRVELDLTYYKAVTNRALVTVTVSAPSGYTSIVENTGKVQNKGIELSGLFKVIDEPNFSWDVNMNYTRNRSLVRALNDKVENVILSSFSNLASLNIVGEAFGVFYGSRYRRNGEGTLVIGSDGFPLVDREHGLVGDPNPDWTAGFSNHLSWRKLSFSFLWDIKCGGDIWNGTRAVMDYLGVSKESGDLREVRDYVFDGVLESGEQNTIEVDFANPTKGLEGIFWRQYGFLNLAENYIEDGSWARLREVTLGYDFPLSKVTNKIDLTLSIYGRNLLLIADYQGIDPETNLRGPSNAQGWDYFNLPNTLSYGLVLNARIN